jgi:hypothetical protein
MTFKFEVSEQEVQNKWAEQTTPNRWIEMYKKLSHSYLSWDVDIKLAEFIINHIKEYVKELPEDLPEVLHPLLIAEIKNDIVENNEKNKLITLEEVADEGELFAIELLKDYDFINYNDAVNLIYEGYEFGKESVDNSSKPLEDYTTAELLAEISRRV